MPAYELDADVRHFQGYVLADIEDLRVLEQLYGTPHQGRWRPIRVELDRESKPAPHGDFPCNFLGGIYPALGQRAVEALRDLLEPVGELLPVECDAEPLWFYNCTRFADVFDEAASDFSRSPSTGRVMTIRRAAWRPEVERETLFRIAHRHRSAVYVTDVVVERMRSAGLRGYKLRE